jgi:hypothetical protein
MAKRNSFGTGSTDVDPDNVFHVGWFKSTHAGYQQPGQLPLSCYTSKRKISR